jgi:hypothetical protein
MPKRYPGAVNQWTDTTNAKKDQGTNNDLQNIAQNTNDRATRTPLDTVGELRWHSSSYYCYKPGDKS